jgi:hypothetical protein
MRWQAGGDDNIPNALTRSRDGSRDSAMVRCVARADLTEARRSCLTGACRLLSEGGSAQAARCVEAAQGVQEAPDVFDVR